MEKVLKSNSKEQHRGGDTQEEDRELVRSFADLHVSVSTRLLWSLDNADKLFPESYRINSPDEIRVLAIAENFQHQYSLLCPDRKPLLLCPVNECGVKKFVSTTIQTIPTGSYDLYYWENCASFVADFLSVDLLEPPTELPRHLFSSTSVLRIQRATCFEFATLLCSLLLGVNYDAYCVSGYAVREMCVLDQSLQDCPLLHTEVNERESAKPEQEEQENKYYSKPKEEPRSAFLMEQEKKRQQEAKAELQKQRLQQESRQPPADPLRGQRVHCWVLVLSGSRSVQENFFIDPLTGNSYSTSDHNFLGIESMWNNFNYYLNLQDCSNGCADMVYDVEDLRMWKPVLVGAFSRKQVMRAILKRKEMEITQIYEENEESEEPIFDMPRSWVNYITISRIDMETRYPGGQKVIHYRKAKLEKFAPYLRSDGLVTRLTTYKDLDCTEVTTVKEWYQSRNDYLEQREVNEDDGFTTDQFKRGRPFHLLFHKYKSLTSKSHHEMEFSNSHVDFLVRRVVLPGEMEETFKGRYDFLHYRHVQFSETDDDNKSVQKVVEHFHRNRSKPASEDVAQRVFLRDKGQIKLVYHLEDNRLIPARRNFIKPQKSQNFTSKMVSSFQVNPNEKPLDLCHMLRHLMKDEEKAVLQFERSDKEVGDIITCREKEEGDVQLVFSPGMPGAARGRKQKDERFLGIDDHRRWLEEMEKDVLAPLLIHLDNTDTLSTEDAKKLHRECLAEYKQRLAEWANLTEEQNEKDTQELQKKEESYQKNQRNMSRQEEKVYQRYRPEKMMQIEAVKMRLSMHEEEAPHKYLALDLKLKRDPRLAPLLLS